MSDQITLTLVGKPVFNKGKYTILLMNDFEDMYIVFDTETKKVKGFSYFQEHMEDLINDLLKDGEIVYVKVSSV